MDTRNRSVLDRTVAADQPWLALQVRSRWERKAASLLSEKGYETFVPLYGSMRSWSDRRKLVQLPLFPGYVFCREREGAQGAILTTPGVMRFVGVGGKPAAVDKDELGAVQKMVDSGAAIHPHLYLRKGDAVEIVSGPLEGLKGFVIASQEGARIVVSVTLLQRAVCVDLEPSWVVKEFGVSSARTPGIGPLQRIA